MRSISLGSVLWLPWQGIADELLEMLSGEGALCVCVWGGAMSYGNSFASTVTRGVCFKEEASLERSAQQQYQDSTPKKFLFPSQSGNEEAPRHSGQERSP